MQHLMIGVLPTNNNPPTISWALLWCSFSSKYFAFFPGLFFSLMLVLFVQAAFWFFPIISSILFFKKFPFLIYLSCYYWFVCSVEVFALEIGREWAIISYLSILSTWLIEGFDENMNPVDFGNHTHRCITKWPHQKHFFHQFKDYIIACT